MSAIKLLGATTFINFFSTAFSRRNGTARPVTIESYNQLVGLANTLAANQVIITEHFRINDTGGPIVLSAMIGGGASESGCRDACLHSDQGTKNQFCCGLNQAYGIYTTMITALSIVSGGAGIYNITLNECHPATATSPLVKWADTAFIAGNLTFPGFITVEGNSASPLLYTMKVYDAAGVLTSGLLNNVLLQVTGYPEVIPGGWADNTN